MFFLSKHTQTHVPFLPTPMRTTPTTTTTTTTTTLMVYGGGLAEEGLDQNMLVREDSSPP
jgi:hypothetical protein